MTKMIQDFVQMLPYLVARVVETSIRTALGVVYPLRRWARFQIMAVQPMMLAVEGGGPMLLERLQIVEGFVIVDLQTGANTGDYVSMKGYDRIVVLFTSAVGTAGDDPTITLQQATSVSGGSVKALNFDTIYRKQATTDLSSTGQWTKTTQTATNTYTEATSAEEDAMWAVEFRAADLDADGGFDCLRATIADIGSNAQLGSLIYILGDPGEALAPESLLSAIAD